MKLLFILLVTIFAPEKILGLLHRCPQEKHFHEFRLKQNITYFNHCTCEKNDSVYVSCQGFKSEKELLIVLNYLRGFIIDQVSIKRSGPLHLSDGLFNKLHIHRLIFDDVRFETVSLFSALKGLEFDLEELQFIKCRVSNWIWKSGKQFIFLETLIFYKTHLSGDVTDSFRKFPTKLRTLKIIECYIQEIGNDALKKMSHLERIELEGNLLTKVSRSMFPNPARRLKHLSLTGNPIVELPQNMFQNMDRLEFLLLSGIKVSSLKNETFYPVWNQLEEIYLNNIRINCDCDIVWMIRDIDASIIRKPFCSSHNKELEDIKNRYEICPVRKARRQ